MSNLDQDAIFEQLEERIEKMAQLLTRLKTRNGELEKSVVALTKERDTVTDQLQKLNEEVTQLRTRNRDAASRVKTLLTQMEQMDLLAEG